MGISVVDDFDEQTHMSPVPWKRIFYHYKEDAIKLPSNAARRTVESEYNKIDFNVTEWAEVKTEQSGQKTEHQETKNNDETHGSQTTITESVIDHVVDIMKNDIIDQVLQEIPDNYDD